MMLSCLGFAGGLAAEAKGGDIADVGHTGAARDTGPGELGVGLVDLGGGSGEGGLGGIPDELCRGPQRGIGGEGRNLSEHAHLNCGQGPGWTISL